MCLQETSDDKHAITVTASKIADSVRESPHHFSGEEKDFTFPLLLQGVLGRTFPV